MPHTSAKYTKEQEIKLNRTSTFYFISEILGREDMWNIVLCIPACFSVVQVMVLPFLPEAPRYLFIEKGDEKACRRGRYISSYSYKAQYTFFHVFIHLFIHCLTYSLQFLLFLALQHLRACGEKVTINRKWTRWQLNSWPLKHPL